MAKQPLNIQEFHGGLNSDSDPRDLRPSESPSLQDVAIDSVGRLKVLGSVDGGTSDSNATSILQNRGLFTMSSDRQLDGNVADETLIFLHDNANHTIDIKDSEGWDTAQINMGGATIPVYYNADGVVRVSDASLTQGSQWFGYIVDERFNSKKGDSGAIGWTNVSQSLSAPTAGKCLMSTPAVGSDTNGVNSSSSEYIGTVADASATQGDVLDSAAVNLRVGIQYDNLLPNLASDVPGNNGADADSSAHYPLIGDNNIFLNSDGNATWSDVDDSSIEYTISDAQSFVVAFYITSGTEYDRTDYVSVTCGTGLDGSHTTGFKWTVSQSDIVTDCWNVVVCSKNTHDSTVGTDAVDWGGDFTHWQIKLEQNSSGTTGNASPSFYVSGPVIAPSVVDGFKPGNYSFHYTWLYDVENKQESLPFKFSDVDNDDSTKDVNQVVIHKNPCLFNFDAYIVPSLSGGYQLNKRISGARIYWKTEENDNYFLLGELDFIDNGFKWLPEADLLAVDLSDSSHSGTFLTYTTIAKGISPESSNIVDTFKSINGFSSEVKSLDAKYKTAVVQGRRTYIGNIKRPDGKTYPDRIVKSQVNRFDTFPEGMGVVDVAIRDGENIVKLEAFADRILQFKENSLYIINVSENIDFLEDTYRNRGCAFDYHVTKTDIGIAWFNIHGVYLYNGKEVSELLVKEGIRAISESDWEAFITDATDDPDTSSAMIGYIPKKKQILIKNENNDVYIYDFVLRAWTTGSGRITESTAMTNFALDADQNLFYVDNTTTVRKTWQPSPQSTTNFIYKTPDIDFGQPSVRKKVYRVRISYKGDADTLTVGYSVNGDTNTIVDFEGTDSTTGKPSGSTDTTPLHDKTDLTVWHHAELKPDTSSEANNIYSFQLHMSGTVDSDFEINDISIIYRMKSVK